VTPPADRAPTDGVPPTSTYRLQLTPDWGLAQAAAAVPHLRALGVGHAYTSPLLASVTGSQHGYDVVDHARVDGELGGEAGLADLRAALDAAGMGLVVDIVPNHMAAVPHLNAWWWDVLEHGPAARHASSFDIDWGSPDPRLAGKVLLPVLDDHYGRVLEAGRISVRHDGGRLVVDAAGVVLPLDPGSTGPLLAAVAARAGSDRLAYLARSADALPATHAPPDQRARRHADAPVLAAMVAELLAEPDVAAALDDELAALGADPDRLDALLDAQSYRLAYWRTARHELDYRRFFDVDSLVGLRAEEPDVFDATHALVLAWVADGVVDGLRVDHPDGLRRPAEYLARLRASAPGAWIVVEKILAGDEELPASWPVDGTTGYEMAARIIGLFVDPAGEAPLRALAHELTGEVDDFAEVARAAQEQVVAEVLGADLARLAASFVALCQRQRRFRDFTRAELTEALAAVAVALPVYRTYVPEGGGADPVDVAVVEGAVAEARRRHPHLDDELLWLLGQVLLGGGAVAGPEATDLRMRFQQFTGVVMAKGVEDTALYRWLPLVALTDVGSEPERFGRPADAFHEANRRVAERWPATMTNLSTHDAKRSEDVRARLAVLSELHEGWVARVGRWRQLARPCWGDGPADAAVELLAFQTVVGAHPLDADRLEAYLAKALREAKRATSWLDPDEGYEERVARFARSLAGDAAFQADLAAFVERQVLVPGRVNALAQKLVQLTSPGVPDLYRGTEVWDLSLVDPDNRRPVDLERLARLLAELDAAEEAAGTVAWPDLAADDVGRAKLLVTSRALRLRRDRPEAFGPGGGYEPVRAVGPAADHAVAFARGGQVVTVAPRLVVGLARRGGWGPTHLPLPPGRWVDALGLRPGVAWEGEVPLAELLDPCPVGLLARIDGGGA
jgi:(1->4)-alpha-D-glucan 1-alpha-D-glucosylmutase